MRRTAHDLCYVRRMASVSVHVKMKTQGTDWLDSLASHYKLSRSDVVRACMAVAKANQEELFKTLKVLEDAK